MSSDYLNKAISQEKAMDSNLRVQPEDSRVYSGSWDFDLGLPTISSLRSSGHSIHEISDT